MYRLKSEIICESQTITSPMSTLVCDCVGGGGIAFSILTHPLTISKGRSVMQVLRQIKPFSWDIPLFAMAPARVLRYIATLQICLLTQPTTLGPISTNRIFRKQRHKRLHPRQHLHHLSGLLLLVESLKAESNVCQQNWFSAPYIPPPISFQWESHQYSFHVLSIIYSQSPSLPLHHSTQGVVVNSAGVGVGVLLGDGVVLTLSDSEVVGQLEVCLLLSTEPPQNSPYSVPDFGYPAPNSQQFYPLGECHSISFVFVNLPLGLSAANITVFEKNSATFWCVTLPFASFHPIGNSATLFPIMREENYEDASTSDVSTTTKALMYTLGVLYCITGLAFFIILVCARQKEGKVRFNVGRGFDL